MVGRLNGTFLGSVNPVGSRTASQRTFTFPPGALRVDADNVLSVLVENMGHNEDYRRDDTHKEARGLTGAVLVGAGSGGARTPRSACGSTTRPAGRTGRRSSSTAG